MYAFKFAVPQLTWVRAFDAGEYDGVSEPSLAVSPQGKVHVVTDADQGSAEFDTASVKFFALDAYSPVRARPVIGRSGNWVLLWDSRLNGTRSFTIANTNARSVTNLKLPAQTSKLSVHLVPGGSLVYVEGAHFVVEHPGEGGTLKRTGRAQLYDSATGKLIRDFVDRRIATMKLLAISPSGKAIYLKDRRYFLLGLGHAFPNQEIIIAPMPNSASVFFADK